MNMAETGQSQYEGAARPDVVQANDFNELVAVIKQDLSFSREAAQGLADKGINSLQSWVNTVDYTPSNNFKAFIDTEYGGTVEIRSRDLSATKNLSNDSDTNVKLLALAMTRAKLDVLAEKTNDWPQVMQAGAVGSRTMNHIDKTVGWIQQGKTVRLNDPDSDLPTFSRQINISRKAERATELATGTLLALALAACKPQKPDFGQPGAPVVVQGPDGDNVGVISGTPTPEGVQVVGEFPGIMVEKTDAATKAAFREAAGIDPALPDENVAVLWVSGNGASFEYASVLGASTQTETGTSTQERLWMKVDGAWTPLIRGEEAGMVVWYYVDPETIPEEGGEVTFEPVLWYPGLTQAEFDAQTPEEREKFFIAASPPAKDADKLPGFNPAEPNRRSMIVIGFPQLQDMMQQAGEQSTLTRTFFGGGTIGEGSTGGDGGGDGAPTPGEAEPTDQPTPAETEEDSILVESLIPDSADGVIAATWIDPFHRATVVVADQTSFEKIIVPESSAIFGANADAEALIQSLFAWRAQQPNKDVYLEKLQNGEITPITVETEDGPKTYDPTKLEVVYENGPSFAASAQHQLMFANGDWNELAKTTTDGWVPLGEDWVKFELKADGTQVIHIGLREGAWQLQRQSWETDEQAAAYVKGMDFVHATLLLSVYEQSGMKFPSDIHKPGEYNWNTKYESKWIIQVDNTTFVTRSEGRYEPLEIVFLGGKFGKSAFKVVFE